METAPLSCFAVVETTNPEEMRALLIRRHNIRAFDLPDGPAGLCGRGNAVELKSVGLSYCTYGAATHITFPEERYVRQNFALSGICKTTVRNTETFISPQRSCIIPAEAEFANEFSPGYEHLVLKIDSVDLNRHLTALLGFQPKQALQFEVAGDFHRPELQSLRRLVMFMAKELELTHAHQFAPVIAELEQALIVSFLYCNRHVFSDCLIQPTPQAAPWQVRLVEEYIEANWNQAITVEGLAAITGASARSIFDSFKKGRGYSPMFFLKQTRLRYANEMLRRADANTSVTAVMFACGFHNPGHFARDYRTTFGELPSETLSKNIGHARKLD
jgi:AraC-like DNA-binding protein